MKTGSPPPAVAFLIGPERWLRRQAVQRLKQQCLAPGSEEADGILFQELPGDERILLEILRTAPFGSPRRLLILDGLEEVTVKVLPWLPAYLSQPNPQALLALCADRLEEGLSRFPSTQVIPCQPLKSRELGLWIAAQARGLGKEIEPKAIQKLVDRIGTELQALSLALEGLFLCVGSRGEITAADVETLIAPSVRETCFDILDLAAAGRPDRAIEQLRHAIAQGRLTVEQLMGALGWHYRDRWRRGPHPSLGSALEEVLAADASLKLGHPAPELLADQLLLKLAN